MFHSYQLLPTMNRRRNQLKQLLLNCVHLVYNERERECVHSMIIHTKNNNARYYARFCNVSLVGATRSADNQQDLDVLSSNEEETNETKYNE